MSSTCDLTCFASCAVMFNKDAFHSDFRVKSIYLHDNRNGQPQAVRETIRMGTTSRRLPCFVLEDTAKWQVLFYHDVAPHMPLLAVRTVDMVVGDVNGAAWRRQSGQFPAPLW